MKELLLPNVIEEDPEIAAAPLLTVKVVLALTNTIETNSWLDGFRR